MARKKGRIQDVAAAEALAKEGQMSETNEDTGLAAEDTNSAVEDTCLATKDIVPATGKAFLVAPRDEVRAEPAPPSMAGSVEETIVETSVDPVAGIVEAALAEDFEVLEKLGKEGLKAAKSAASSFSGSFRMFATETRDTRRIVSKAEPLRWSIARRQILAKCRPDSDRL